MATVSSSASSTQTATVSPSVWWLKDPTDDSRNMTIRPTRRMLDRSEPEEGAVFRPLGRRTAVVVHGELQSEEMPLDVYTLDSAELANLDALLDSQRTLLLQASGQQWYVEAVGKRTRSRVTVDRSGATPKHKVSGRLVEVDAP